MNNRMKYLLFLLPLILLSCEKEIDPNPSKKYDEWLIQSYEYYPLEVGSYRTYQVDSIYFERRLNVLRSDTISDIFRESIVDTFRNLQNELTYRIIKERQSGDNWLTDRVYSVVKSRTKVVRTEENISLVDLVFPFKKLTSWDAFIYTDKNRDFLINGRRIYLYKNFTLSYVKDSTIQTVLGNNTSVITVEDGDSDDLIERQLSRRYYAKGIGLIRKEQEFYGDQTTLDRGIPWDQKAETGFKLTQSLIDFK